MSRAEELRVLNRKLGYAIRAARRYRDQRDAARIAAYGSLEFLAQKAVAL